MPALQFPARTSSGSFPCAQGSQVQPGSMAFQRNLPTDEGSRVQLALEAPSAGVAELTAFMERLHLQKYLQVLLDEEYEDVEELRSLTFQEATRLCDDVLQMRDNSKRKFMKALGIQQEVVSVNRDAIGEAMVPCKFCFTMVLTSVKRKHESECDKRVETCPQCQQRVVAEDLQEHFDTLCSERPLAVECRRPVVEEKPAEPIDPADLEVPEEFLCPIGYDLMVWPVETADKHVYDKENILTWFVQCKSEGTSITSPLTNLVLASDELVPADDLRKKILEWTAKREAILGRLSEADLGQGRSQPEKRPTCRTDRELQTELERVLACGEKPLSIGGLRDREWSSWVPMSGVLNQYTFTPLERQNLRWACSVLNVPGECSASQVHNLYRQLARLFHPDKCTLPHSQLAMQQVNDAWELLQQTHGVRQWMLGRSSLQSQNTYHSTAYWRLQLASKEEQLKMRKRREDCMKRLRAFCAQHPIAVDRAALQMTLDDARRWGVHTVLRNNGLAHFKRAQQHQNRAFCEAWGGANLDEVILLGRASRMSLMKDEDLFYEVGIAPCKCGQEHFWTVECLGQTGDPAWDPRASHVNSIVDGDGTYVGTTHEATHRAELAYNKKTNLDITEATDPPYARPGLWCSVGRRDRMLCFLGEGEGGREADEVVWQFQLLCPQDAFQAGWHNYRHCPETGKDPNKIMEDLHYQQQCYAYQQSRRLEKEVCIPIGSVSDRLVRSGKYHYRVAFGDDPSQTNSQTGVQKKIRRAPYSKRCQCDTCNSFLSTAREAAKIRCQSATELPAGAEVTADADAEAEEIVGEGEGCPKLPEQVICPLLHTGTSLTNWMRADGRGVPSFWSGNCTDPIPVVSVEKDSFEYKVVSSAFIGNMRDTSMQEIISQCYTISAIQRVENTPAFLRYKAQRDGDGPNAEETLMIHGCRSEAAEVSIAQQGFIAQGSGTWFAYFAPYSDGGYAFQDRLGDKHLFIAVVLKANAAREDGTKPKPQNLRQLHCRVVTQDRAYPQWIVRYRLNSVQ